VKPYLKQCAPPEFSATLPPIEQTICDLRVRHPGLDDDAPVGQVDLEHAAHPRDRDEHALGDGQRAARQARAGAARDPRHAGLRARPHDVADLGRAAGEHDRTGRRAVLQQAVGLVRAQLDAVGEDVRGAADRAQARQQRGRERRGFGGDGRSRDGHVASRRRQLAGPG
jgi:hypothetical protein